jgi:hypothetical protein
MGFRGALKQGGGFWNNVDGTVKDYSFTTVGPGKSGEESEWVYFVPAVQVDGADAASTQHLFLGGADRYEISDDGHTITAADGGNVTIGANTPTGKFLDSLIEAGFPESNLPDLEAGEALNLEGMIGTRIRLKQQKDEEGTKKRGKRIDPKTKKEYDRTETVVSNVYSLPGGAAKAASKGGPKLVAGTNEVRDKADEAIIALCQAAAKADKKNATGRIPTSKLSVGVLKQLAGDKLKDAVRKMVNDEAYLTGGTERGMFVFDETESTVELAA